MSPKEEKKSLDSFARLLGWPPLKSWQHRIPAEVQWEGERVVRWWEAEVSPSLFLQINVGSPYEAAVYAIRYRICTGWHPFRLTRNMAAEARRLHGFLAFCHFESPAARREFRRLHPECSGWTWRRIQAGGRLPYGRD